MCELAAEFTANKLTREQETRTSGWWWCTFVVRSGYYLRKTLLPL